jgi:inorganic pyrophosphatase
MVDKDEVDEKVVAIPVNGPAILHYADIIDLPKHIKDEISHFLKCITARTHRNNG